MLPIFSMAREPTYESMLVEFVTLTAPSLSHQCRISDGSEVFVSSLKVPSSSPLCGRERRRAMEDSSFKDA